MSTTQFPAVTIVRARRKLNLEFLLAVLLALSIALIFWSQQRYPALLKKLHAGSGVKVGARSRLTRC